MSSFFIDLWESIFTPGPTPTILYATNLSFGALQLVLLALLFATASVHFVVLSVLCGGLWWGINWFARELALAREQEREQDGGEGTKKKGESKVEESSDTEVEMTTGREDKARGRVGMDVRSRRGGAREEVKLKEEEDVEEEGKHAGVSQSSASTEDEWEKVSRGK
ncbi:hypothetical protein E4U43_004477 [Claviceps pusilla]|uniref:PKR1 protein n=1 Tax=Claviceps pusilla TaxID=123648 RepID=A0A9P7N5H7_9HYPO|nr:hypothetical protein E4U43_004477 [Claviceps pusilla]